MATEATLQTIERLIVDLYRDRDELSRDEIWKRLADEELGPDVTTYFAHLPEGDYTIDELAEVIAAEFQLAGPTEDLGLLT